jgi:hypothetical protein
MDVLDCTVVRSVSMYVKVSECVSACMRGNAHTSELVVTSANTY